MDGTETPPAAPLTEPVPPKHAPLAPSQELAYRKKCIQLKRRLTEIEANNDATKRRIEQETRHVQKMRLMRAILLDHLKNITDTPAKKLTQEQLEELGITTNGVLHPAELIGNGGMTERPEGEGLLDDSSEESEEEPEVPVSLEGVKTR